MAKAPSTQTEPKPTPAPPPEAFSLVPNEKVLAIYAAMVKCRMLEQRATLLFQQGKLDSDLHASSGREASTAAIVTELGPSDALSITPGDWLPAFVKGITLENLFRTLAPSSIPPNGHEPPAPADLDYKNILFAGDDAHRIEAIRDHAEPMQTSQSGAVIAAYLPNGSSLPKPWHALMTAASSKRLPIVFVRYTDSDISPRESPARGKSKNPQALIHGVPAIAVDAHDAVAVYRVAYEAILRARQGRGATLLECSFFTPTSAGESPNPSASTDPISGMEAYLKRKGIQPEQHNVQIVADFNRDLELATRFLDR